jgi:hypothetical protein
MGVYDGRYALRCSNNIRNSVLGVLPCLLQTHFYNFGTCGVEKNAAMLAAEIKLLMDSIFLPIIMLLPLYVLEDSFWHRFRFARVYFF